MAKDAVEIEYPSRKRLVDLAKAAGVKKANFIKQSDLLAMLRELEWAGISLSDENMETLEELENIWSSFKVTGEVTPVDVPILSAEKVSEFPFPNFSREEMEAAARDMNKIMELEPGIDLTLDDAHFVKSFTKAARMVEAEDAFSEETWKILKSLGLAPDRNSTGAQDDIPVEDVTPAKSVKSTEDVSAVSDPEPVKAANSSHFVGVGVVARIKDFIIQKYNAKEEFTKQEILDTLVTAFPDRDAKGMGNTITIQLTSSEMLKKRGFKFDRLPGKKYRVLAIPA